MELIDLASVAVRALAFIATLQAAGLAWFAVACCREGADRARVRRWARRLAGVAIALVVVHRAMDAGRLAGEWSGILDTKLQALVWRRAPGTSALASVLGLAVVALGSARLAALGAVAVVASFALTGHTATAQHARAMQVLLVGHVGVIAFWFGGVAGLLWVDDLASAASQFSRRAIWLVPWTVVLGALLIWGLVPGWSAFHTTYGELLLVKLAGFLAVLVLAAVNRSRVVPAIVRGESSAAQHLRRIAMVEAALLACVLAVTATMTALFSCH